MAVAEGRHTEAVTPATARRLLYVIVLACVTATAGADLLRPAPPPVSAPQYAVTIPPRLPFEVPVAPPGGLVIVQANGSTARSARIGGALPVHGLPGQVGASP